ncbi:hypothetical protein NEOLEDRAFT_1181332 [Neolentinus lepideus HHB14362 ss-1]|uniref:Aminoglycoside phosphotransferase domain-containing protein n=1 Tax=Neolentinus lepideus HHB14362 ss-1 TaxID=1314782 RepID=A0A165Q5I4_9AGAM|nr:hypothetical protein NEOLEDRAFT_1181332 [Neolentinus lepideus HHB14362 ss-1]
MNYLNDSSGSSLDRTDGLDVSLDVSLDQVKAILRHGVGPNVHVESMKELKTYGYSFPSKVYEIQTTSGDSTTTYILKVTSPDPSSSTEYKPNSLVTSVHLHSTISSKSTIPLPAIYATNSSCTLVPYPYMLTARPAGIRLSEARGQLSERQNALIDLRLGSYLQQLHAIDNDWFGMPTETGADPAEPSYSWQESFTLFLEEMLYEAEGRGEDLPFSDIRGWLSRAIGFYLFDDVEVPKLIWFTGGEDEIYVDIPSSSSSDEEPRVSAFLNLTHAFWGDPLLESLFYSPSPALIEGYGGPLIIFPRQNTKRLWYNLFWALLIMKEAASDASAGNPGERRKWASEVVQKCLDELKDAPCY